MCDYEEFLFTCGCSQIRLKSYCHFARNDPNHQCFGVKKLRDVWEQRTACSACLRKRPSTGETAAAAPVPYHYHQWQQAHMHATQRQMQ